MFKFISRTILYCAVFYALSSGGVSGFSIEWWIVFISLIGITVISELN